MACFDENLIVAFFAPERSPAVAAEVDAHAAGCVSCRRLLAEYAKLAARDTLVAAGVPSLTPSAPGAPGEPLDVADDRALLVQRLAQAQAKSRIGTVLKGKWEIEGLLGAGGMGFVFAAKHRNGRRVAIKTMRAELALETSLVERFLREGYIANKIEHPGAVAILDDDVTDDGTPFLVMELLVGESLRERVARGPMPLDEALAATAQVLDVLAAAHDKGIVHRDLKPDNLFATTGGAIKVLDFGIARVKEHTRPALDTRSGTTMGTIGYMPPEQARGLVAEIDARSDVWAIGATLYSLLTARSLHEATTTNESLLLAMTTPVPPMCDLVPSLPPAVQDLLDRSLAFAKDARFESARAMKDAVDAARAAAPRALPTGVLSPALSLPLSPALSLPPSPALSPPRRASRSAIALVVVSALMAGGFAVWRVEQRAGAPAKASAPPPLMVAETPPEPSPPSASATPTIITPLASASTTATASVIATSRPRPPKARAITSEPAASPAPPPESRDPLGQRR